MCRPFGPQLTTELRPFGPPRDGERPSCPLPFVWIRVVAATKGAATEGRPCKDQSAGCFRISARACSRFASAVLFAVPALVPTEGARLLSFAIAFRFRRELSAL